MSKPWRIFLVEEDENLNQNIVNSLSKDGYTVQSVASTKDAVRILWTEEYDVVICGLKSASADGLELLQWLRASRPNSQVMMMGGEPAETVRTQALESGAICYLEKPLDLRLLREELQRLHQQTGFSASLDSFDLLDVIQIVTMSRKNIVLLVNTGLEEQGILRFQGGELVWAEYGVLRGEEAFFALAAHKNGNVIHQPWNEQMVPNVTQPLSRLILQALQYRTKYAHMQQSGEQKAMQPSSLPTEPESDKPFVTLTQDNGQDVPFRVLTDPEVTVSGAGGVHGATKEWWQQTGKISSVSIGASGTPSVSMETPAPLSPGDIMRGNSPNIVPATVHKTLPGQRVELPSWLMDQPTTEMPAVGPSSLSGSAHLPMVPPGKPSPAEWQPSAERPAGKTTGPIGPKQTTGPQKTISTDTAARRISRPMERQLASPEWQPPSSPLPPSVSRPTPRSGPLQSLNASRRTSGPLGHPGMQESGQRAAVRAMTGPQRTVKRNYNYASLVSSLQTVGHSVRGFIATAVVSMDGQPIAQITVDDLDISRVCKHFGTILQGVLHSLDQEAWGNHENTIISSANYHILMCIVGEARNAFQLLITTRESNPMEGLEAMAGVRDAINVALRPA
jgi:DNA-binding response OmpR family regulator/predicted regulator of Ras-like GTPase activity (Roadblock/LC7/MglB family)